jgi:hypothetical protein
MLRTWYPLRTISLLASTLAAAFAVHAMIDFFDEIDRANRTGRSATVSTTWSLGPNLIFQVVGLAGLVVLVLEIVWILRIASFARAAGMPGGGRAPQRTPGLAAASVVIPIVNLWWPWESIRDCLPIGHPARRLVTRWWILSILSGFVVIGGFVLALVPLAMAVLLFALLAILPVAELLALRQMIDEIDVALAAVAGVVGPAA